MIRQEENSKFQKVFKEYRQEIMFVVTFVGGLLISFFLLHTPLVANSVIKWITIAETWVAAQVLELIGFPNVQQGNMISGRLGNNFRMEVQNNCNGVYESVIFLMAFIAIQIPWRRKIGWMLAGFTVFHIINELRLVTLFIIGSHYPHDTFVFFHETFWNYALVIFTLIIFLFCAYRISKADLKDASAAPSNQRTA